MLKNPITELMSKQRFKRDNRRSYLSLRVFTTTSMGV